MAWLFLIVVCGIAIYCNWNWCWQQMKFARGWAKYLRARINKKPATALLYMAGFLILAVLWFFGSDVYYLYVVLSNEIKKDGNTPDEYLSIAYRYFGILAVAGTIVGYFIAIVRNMIADNRNIIADNRNIIADERNRVNEGARITESMVQAIAQIGTFNDGKPNIEVRLGGLYSLQRIMQDSPRDELTIAKIFYAYVRENAKRDRNGMPEQKSRIVEKTYQLPEDIQAALGIINQFNQEKKGQDEEFSWNEQLNFSRADFSNYSLANMYFVRSILSNANLSNADLQFTNFPHANLCDANLSGAYFYFANFTDALLLKADLSFANLSCVNLARANLHRANFTGASLVNADLSNATCGGANFANADLLHADLSGVDLSSTINLFQEELNEANGDAKTKLPAGLIRPESWNKTKNSKKTP